MTSARPGSRHWCTAKSSVKHAGDDGVSGDVQREATSDMTAEAADVEFSGSVRVVQGTFKQETTHPDTKLEDALQDLREARDEAREDGFPEPSDTVIANAERLLKAMYEISPQRFEVYPTPDAEIAIDVPGGYGESNLLLCESSGAVYFPAGTPSKPVDQNFYPGIIVSR